MFQSSRVSPAMGAGASPLHSPGLPSQKAEPQLLKDNKAFSCHVKSTAAIVACIDRLASSSASDDRRKKFLEGQDVVRWIAERKWQSTLTASSYALLQEMGGNVLGPVAWATRWRSLDVGQAPKVPPFVTRDLLFSECPLKADGTRVKDSHLLVLIPSRVNGHPASIAQFFEVAFGERWESADIHAALTDPVSDSKWILIPKDPGLKTAAEPIPPGYREATAVELFLSMMVASSPEDAFPAGVSYRCALDPLEPKEHIAVTSPRKLRAEQSPLSLCHPSDPRIRRAIVFNG